MAKVRNTVTVSVPSAPPKPRYVSDLSPGTVFRFLGSTPENYYMVVNEAHKIVRLTDGTLYTPSLTVEIDPNLPKVVTLEVNE